MDCASCGSTLPDGARFCPACGTAAAEPAPTTEERKLATVLFADLVASTALGGSQDPERTRAMLDRFYEAMAKEIERAGGTVEKFVGDAVMAAFGAPAAHEDHAERALHAALAMRRRLRELFGDALAMRIGVNTGEVVVGTPREGSSFVTGDAVNVTARLEQHAGPGEILVGERTAAAVRGAFELGEPVRIEAKGKEDGVVARRLVRALTLMRPRGVGGLGAAFVGRESELEVLWATYRRVVTQAEPHLVTIMGDAGVGKTRLVRELWAWLGGQDPQPVQRTGRCLPYGHATYWALGEVLKEHLDILESDPPEAALSRLEGREILGLTLGLDVAGDQHPLAVRDRLHGAWAEFLQELVTGRPTVVLVEDLHWAEEPVLDLLERVLRDVHGPLLLLGTARPEMLDRRPAWGGGRRNASLLWLEPLGPEDSLALLDRLLAGQVPRRLRSLVVARAEGNPFFVEELIGAFVDRGVLRREDGSWTAGELPDDFSVPDSVHAILAARIDLLDPAAKAALQAAAVIGRTFWRGPLRELLGTEPDLLLLEDRDFVRRRPGSSIEGEDEYAFKHALTREVAYGGLTKARRARLHAGFAEWLETFGGGRDEHAPLLAHHYAAAVRLEDADLAWPEGDPELPRLRRQAVLWLRRAGEGAIRRYALRDAIQLLRGALALEPSRDAQAEIWRSIGRAHAIGYEGQAFWEAMENALAVSDDASVRAETYAELAFQTSVRSGMWKRPPRDELVQGWIDRALELAEPGSRAHVHALIAEADWSRDPAEAAAREASALADRIGDPDLRSWALGARTATAAAAGRHDEAWNWAQRRFDLAGQIDDPDHVMEIHESFVPACLGVGRTREAKRLAEEADVLAARLSTHHQVHGVSLRLEVAEAVGDWPAVQALAGRTRRVVGANAKTPCARNERSLLVCAAAAQILGEPAQAVRLEAEAAALGMEGYELATSGPLMRLALARGELGRVGELVEAGGSHHLTFGIQYLAARLDALAALRDRERIESEVPQLATPGSLLEPFALRALGLVRGDGRLVERADERFRALGLDWHAEQTRLILES